MTDTAAAEAPIYSVYASDPELSELVDVFVAELPGRITALSDFADRDDWGMVARLADQFQGAALTYGFAQLAPTANAVHRTLSDGGQHAQVRAHIDTLADLVKRVRPGKPLHPAADVDDASPTDAFTR